MFQFPKEKGTLDINGLVLSYVRVFIAFHCPPISIAFILISINKDINVNVKNSFLLLFSLLIAVNMFIILKRPG